MNFEAFDIVRTPLDGITFIEASAGTGKTFTISRLFLRLILNGTPLPEILAVTFTTAATEELRERIRADLIAARNCISARQSFDNMHTDRSAVIEPGAAPTESGDAGLLALLTHAGDLNRSRTLIDAALQTYDDAAVYTIHGFCQRVLQEQAFESGVLFESELSTDLSDLLKEVAYDFWRRHVQSAAPEVLAYARIIEFHPDAMVRTMKLLLNHSAAEVLNPDDLAAPNDSVSITTLRAAYTELRDYLAQWNFNAEMITDVYAEYHGAIKSRRSRSRTEKDVLECLAYFQEEHPALIDLLKLFAAADRLLPEKKPANVPELLIRMHAFVRLHATVCRQLHSELLRIQNRFLDEFRPELDRRKAERGVAGYDDLLNRLRAALMDSERGPELTRTLQRRYRAALIDEFQDTDPVQWDIFRTLFAHRSHSLFLIGDPRQSIYRFRGADVQAYLNARNNARRLTTLTVNYRQRSALLRGINIIFNENASGPVFLHEHIQYRELESAGKADPFTPDVLREQAPLVIWHLSEADAEEQQWRTDDLSEMFMQSMAREIQLLLRSPSSSDALRARDIAVLVRTNDEGEQVRNTLATWNIPAVLHSDRSVFATPEADDFEKILNAMANPGDPMGVKQALCTPSFGYTVQAIQALNIGQDGSVFLRFQLAHEHWQREGFLSAFQFVLNKENLRERILARPGGERALTNLLHLAEIVHADCHGQGAEQTLRYVARNRQAPGSDESHILRLESDRDAVRIMTIHLSKGLEFPVVFCPFLWRGRNASGPDHLFAYDPETGGTCFVSRTLREYRELLAQADAIESLSTTTEAQDNGDCIRLTVDELQRMQRLESRAREAELAEEVRLFYVAATRASQRLYLCWGRTRNTARSAAAWVLHGRRRNASPETKLTLSAEDIQADHADLEARSDGLLRVIHPDDSPGLLNDGLINETHPGQVKSGGRTDRNQSDKSQSARNQSANIQPANSLFIPEQAQHRATIRTAGGPYERRWQIYSYTSLFGTGQRDEHLFHLFDLARDHDGGPGHTGRAHISDATGEESAEQFDIFTFPAGARAGICLHAIFEELAFDENPEGIANVVTRQLSHYQFDVRFVKAISDMVRDTLQCNLIEANGNAFCLRDVVPSNRLTELAFYYPINSTASDASHMRGFIDLVCAHADRYYLLDWKSNHLGDRAADYTTAALAQEMTRSDYHKQYMIYLDALDRYLSYRLPDYDYETHIGGVFYIFLRGVQQGDSTGIYYHRPEKSELEDFRRQLSGDPSESKSFTQS